MHLCYYHRLRAAMSTATEIYIRTLLFLILIICFCLTNIKLTGFFLCKYVLYTIQYTFLLLLFNLTPEWLYARRGKVGLEGGGGGVGFYVPPPPLYRTSPVARRFHINIGERSRHEGITRPQFALDVRRSVSLFLLHTPRDRSR